jgi:PTH1 family peptidyl-tRNA hydrolase
MLVVGLGNPGPRYAGSPHNVGFRVVDHFVEHHIPGQQVPGHQASAQRSAGQVRANRPVWSERFDAELAMTTVDSEQVVLLKPLTYMNRSGESVRKALSFFKIAVPDALVVHDELDLPLGSVKLKRGGGEAGHNGLKSVSAELGTRDYVRLRVGVGRPAVGEVSDFLLSPLPSAAATELEASFDEARAAIDLWVRHGVERAMNLVNRKVLAGKASPERLPANDGTQEAAASEAAGDERKLVDPEAGQPD